MNVIFHTSTAIGIVVMLTDTNREKKPSGDTEFIGTAIIAFCLGIISHGALDYIPHCYPVNSKLDAILGLTMILSTTWITKKRYRLVMGLCFLGSIFPDIIDLLPRILNKELHLNLAINNKIFPWHLDKWSGSVYDTDCNNSALNHSLLLITISAIFWCRKTDFKNIFSRS